VQQKMVSGVGALQLSCLPFEHLIRHADRTPAPDFACPTVNFGFHLASKIKNQYSRKAARIVPQSVEKTGMGSLESCPGLATAAVVTVGDTP
jgi:hypothetical protein